MQPLLLQISDGTLSDSQLETLTVLNAVLSAFSLLGSLFILYMFVAAKELRSFAFRLVCAPYIIRLRPLCFEIPLPLLAAPAYGQLFVGDVLLYDTWYFL